MKPLLALDLSLDSVALLSRPPEAEGGAWWREGVVRLDDPDFGDALARLRARGERRVGADAPCYVVLPDSQLLFSTYDRDDRRPEVTIRQALQGRTPYAVEDLAFDYVQRGDRLEVAVAALDTLLEAEGFAAEHGFRPVGFCARPEEGKFRGVPWFGPTAVAAEMLDGERVEPPGAPFRVVAAPPLPEPEPEPKPEPEPQPQAEPEPRPEPAAAAVAAPQPEPSAPPAGDAEPDGTAEPATPEAAPVAPPAPVEAPVQAAAPTEPVSPAPPEEAPPPVDAPVDTGGDPAPSPAAPAFASRRAGEAAADAAPRLSGVTRTSAPDAPKDAPAGPTRHLAATSLVGAVSSLPRAEPERVSGLVAEARSRKAEAAAAPAAQSPPRARPRRVGLALTLLLIAGMGGVAGWAALFLDEPAAGPETVLGAVRTQTSGDDDTETAAPAPRAATASGTIAAPEPVRLPEAPADGTSEVAAAPAGPGGPAAPRAAVAPAPAGAPEPSGDVAAAPEAGPAVQLVPIAPAAGAAPDEPDAPPALAAASGTAPAEGDAAAALSAPEGGDAAPAAEGPATPVAPAALAGAAPEAEAAAPEAPAEPAPSAEQAEAPAPTGELDGAEAQAAAAPVAPEAPAADAAPSDAEAAVAGTDAPEPAEALPVPPDPEEVARRAALARVRPQPRAGEVVLDTAPPAPEIEIDPARRAALLRVRPAPRPGVDEAALAAARESAAASLVALAEEDAEAAAEEDEDVSALALPRSGRPGARPSSVVQQAARAEADAQRTAPRAPTPAASATRQTLRSAGGNVNRAATETNQISLNRINLIGTYGSASSRRALVRLANGRYVKVEVGDRLDRGRVIAVGDGVLRYQRGGRNLELRMPRS
ncbi:hypothetical protein [Jannaschia sp. W003]|uniref:hypothetical protein n=1 Tax=Jannaschia sp. W003 TaxID=2867012 RepID=UPI0021A909FA|nr:hypothetical protein [Jannaschia sp. W003]UWQ22656.1 hypothetical protein K3554_06425 [Jannaschia sp. W003]